MYKQLEQIDISGMDVGEIRELAKDEFVYIVYNAFSYEVKLFEQQKLPKPDFETCWRIRPLSYRVNDNKTDDEVFAFMTSTMMHRFTTIVRMEV